MKSKKILIIVIIIMAILVTAGGVLAYLFIATDTFKSDKELFAKYIYQNMEPLQEIGNSQMIQKYKDIENEKKYESNTDIKVVYSEGGEVSNPFNNLAAKLNIQKDADEEYFYADGQILFNQEEYLESEIIKDKELYGIRFSDVTKQFVSIKDDSNLEKVANSIGTDVATLQKIIDTINGTVPITNELITQNEMKTLKEKYSNIITEAISNGTFSSNKKAMITYNNNTIKAKAYTVTLNSQQVENLILQILNNIKTETVITNKLNDESFGEQIDEKIKSKLEEEISDLKITVYEQNSNTIRTILEVGQYKIVLENTKQNGQVQSNIQINNLKTDKTDEIDIELTKNTTENQETINLTANVTKEDEDYTLGFQTEIKQDAQNIKFNATASYKKDILTASVMLENTVDMTSDIEKKEILEKTNNVTLNDMEEERMNKIIEALKTNVPLKFQKRLELLSDALTIPKNEVNDNVSEDEMTQVEINKFNSKFEFYTGNEVSAENVKSLLNIVEENLGSYEIKLDENQENINEMSEDELKYIIKLNIEKDKKDEEGIKQVLAKIKDKKKYKISISYKEKNQLIDNIIIEAAGK